MIIKLSNRAYKTVKSKKFQYFRDSFFTIFLNEHVKTKNLISLKKGSNSVQLKEVRLKNKKLKLDYRVVFSEGKGEEIFIVDIFKKQRQRENNRIVEDFLTAEKMLVKNDCKEIIIL